MKISRRRYACCPDAEAALVKVRELSERATLRPAPLVLRCVPLATYAAPPAPPAWEFRRELLLKIVDRKS